jgi:hypothetical protein
MMKSLLCLVTTVGLGVAVSGSVSAQGWVQRATGGRVTTPAPIRNIAPNGISMSRPNPAHTASELKPMPSSNTSRQAQGPNRGIPIVPQNNTKSNWDWVHRNQQQEIIRSQQELIHQKQTLINQKQAFIQQIQNQQPWNSQPQWNPNPPFGGQPQQQLPPGAAIASGILQIVGAGIQASQANGSR